MRIANPIYDHAFKYLMSNNRLAKKVLSTILDEEVVELSLAQQELVVKDTIRQFTLYRLDFKATIVNADGRHQKVLIELQKSKLPTNVLRFRNYLGLTYTEKKRTKASTTPEALPIVAIYLLGYNLVDIPVMAVKVDRQIINASTKEPLYIESDFIDLLTHRCYVLQVQRLPQQRKTRLEQFMTLFNQAWVSDDNYVIDLQEVPEAFKDVAKYLQNPLLDEQMWQQLSGEEEIDSYFAYPEALLAEAKKKTQEAKKREQEAAEKREKDERQQKEEAKKREEAAKANEKATRIKLAKKMLKYGEKIPDIISETGLSAAEIDELKK